MNPTALSDAAILIIDHDLAMRNTLQRMLRKHYGLVEVALNSAEGEQLRRRCHFDLVIVDERLPDGSGTQWLQQLREQDQDTDVIVTTGQDNMDVVIDALRSGARDILRKPYRDEEINLVVNRCLLKRDRARHAFAQPGQVSERLPASPQGSFIGEAPAIRHLLQLVERVAPTQSTVLIQGETGTGKELVAQSIHHLSGRSGPFVPVNCGSIAPDLLESELFGHTRGAFTGAHAAREGLCHFANQGTLFLDEIGEMPLAMQAKLLRMLETHAIRPVGSEREVQVDCRIVAATNRQLAELVRVGAFREDLFYRLNVVMLEVPALRERREDIPMLCKYFVHKLAEELGIPAYPLSQQDMRELRAYAWPGNVRELRNVLERTLLLGMLPTELLQMDNLPDDGTQDDLIVPEGWTLCEVERRYMLDVLAGVDGNKSEAARRLGISRKTIERKLHEWRHESVD